MKNDLPFFSHDNNARNHPKMKALIAEYGYEGYGRFWALNERIAETSGAFIDISKKVYKLDLAKELNFNSTELDDYLSFLSDPEIDLINIVDGKITTDRINDLYQKAIKKRQKQRKSGQKNDNQEIADDFDKIDGDNQEIADDLDTEEKRIDKNRKEKKRKEFTAQSAEQETSLVTKNKLELTNEQRALFAIAKTSFDCSKRAEAMIYKDRNTAAFQMRKLKEIVIACTKIEPEFPADFLRMILEHFRIMTNGKLRGKAEFTPRSLSTPWVWEAVIGSLPDNEGITPELLESVRGLYK